MIVPIQGFEKHYAIESTGKVFSYRTNRWLKGRLIRRYLKVGLYVTKTDMVERAIHRLVAQAFIPNPLSYPEVNHLDGNRLNNDVSNLEWTTTQGNAIHAFALGLRKYNPSEYRYRRASETSRVLSAKQEQEVKELYASGLYTQKKLGEDYNVNRTTIMRIVNNKHKYEAVTR